MVCTAYIHINKAIWLNENACTIDSYICAQPSCTCVPENVAIENSDKCPFKVFFKHLLGSFEADFMVGQGLIRKKKQNCI